MDDAQWGDYYFILFYFILLKKNIYINWSFSILVFFNF